jgi:hypothetical protein
VPSKKASLINFRQPQRSSESEPGQSATDALDAFVNNDPGIPTPSLPGLQANAVSQSAEDGAAAPAATEPERRNVTLSLRVDIHKALKMHASRVEKKLMYLMEDYLESELDQHWPDWRNHIK